MTTITNAISSQLLGYTSPSNAVPLSANQQQTDLLAALSATPQSLTDSILTQQGGQEISLSALLAASTPSSLLQQSFSATNSFNATLSLLSATYASSFDITA